MNFLFRPVALAVLAVCAVNASAQAVITNVHVQAGPQFTEVQAGGTPTTLVTAPLPQQISITVDDGVGHGAQSTTTTTTANSRVFDSTGNMSTIQQTSSTAAVGVNDGSGNQTKFQQSSTASALGVNDGNGNLSLIHI